MAGEGKGRNSQSQRQGRRSNRGKGSSGGRHEDPGTSSEVKGENQPAMSTNPSAGGLQFGNFEEWPKDVNGHPIERTVSAPPEIHASGSTAATEPTGKPSQPATEAKRPPQQQPQEEAPIPCPPMQEERPKTSQHQAPHVSPQQQTQQHTAAHGVQPHVAPNQPQQQPHFQQTALRGKPNQGRGHAHPQGYRDQGGRGRGQMFNNPSVGNPEIMHEQHGYPGAQMMGGPWGMMAGPMAAPLGGGPPVGLMHQNAAQAKSYHTPQYFQQPPGYAQPRSEAPQQLKPTSKAMPIKDPNTGEVRFGGQQQQQQQQQQQEQQEQSQREEAQEENRSKSEGSVGSAGGDERLGESSAAQQEGSSTEIVSAPSEKAQLPSEEAGVPVTQEKVTGGVASDEAGTVDAAEDAQTVNVREVEDDWREEETAGTEGRGEEEPTSSAHSGEAEKVDEGAESVAGGTSSVKEEQAPAEEASIAERKGEETEGSETRGTSFDRGDEGEHTAEERTSTEASRGAKADAEEWEEIDEWEAGVETFAKEQQGRKKAANQDGTEAQHRSAVQYSKEFLLSLKDNLECQNRPSFLEKEEYKVLRLDMAQQQQNEPRGGRTRRTSQQQGPSRSDSFGDLKDHGRPPRTRSGPKTEQDDMWKKKQQPPPPSSHPQPAAWAKLHRTENRYTLHNVQDEEEQKQRTFKSILNKLTPQNYNKLFSQILDEGIFTATTLRNFISQVFDKALMEPKFCELYGKLCQDLSRNLQDEFGWDEEQNKPLTFRRLLLNKCQEEFYKGERVVHDAVANLTLNESEEARKEPPERAGDEKLEEIMCKPKSKVTDQELKYFREGVDFQARLARRRKLGHMHFLGELYKNALLTHNIILTCVANLLGLDKDPPVMPDDEQVEALCKLLNIIGDKLDIPKYKEHMDKYFERMQQIADERRVDSRRRFMIQDTVDLRNNGWRTAKPSEGPKRIDEVHRDARKSSSGRPEPAPPGAARAPPGAAPSQGMRRSNPSSSDEQRRGSMPEGPTPRPMKADIAAKTSLKPNAPAQRGTGAPQGNQDIAQQEVEKSAAKEEEAESSAAATKEAEEASEQPKGISDEELEAKRRSTLSFLYDEKKPGEAAEEVKQWNRADAAPTTVRAAILEDGFNRKEVDWALLSVWMKELVAREVYAKEGILEGLQRAFDELPDAVCDLPKGPKYVGIVTAGLVHAEVLSIKRLVVELKRAAAQPLEEGEDPISLVEEGHAIPLLSSALSALSEAIGEERARQAAHGAGLPKALEELAPEGERQKGVGALTSQAGLRWLTPMISVNEALDKWERGDITGEQASHQVRDVTPGAKQDVAKEAFRRALAKPSERPAAWGADEAPILMAALDTSGMRDSTALMVEVAALDGAMMAWHEGPCQGKRGALVELFKRLLDEEMVTVDALYHWKDARSEFPQAKQSAVRETASWFLELDQMNQEDVSEDEDDDDDEDDE